VDLGVSAVGSLPQLGVTHGSQEVRDLFSFVFAVGLNLQLIDLLQNLGFFVQELLQSKSLFVFLQLSRILNFLCFIQSPSFELVVENFEVFALLGVHASLNLFLVLDFFLFSQLGLL